MLLATSILQVNGLAQSFSDAVKLSYCPASAMEFEGVVIEAEQPANVTDPKVVAGSMPLGG